MPTFATPKPISVTLDLYAGDARIIAGERDDTVVEVTPADKTNESNVRAAEQTKIEYADGVLLVRTPKPRGLGRFTKGSVVDVSIQLPAGSDVRAELSMGDLWTEGQLGECDLRTGMGRLQLDQVGSCQARTGMGDVHLRRSTGRLEALTGSGAIRVGEVDGPGVLKNSNGRIWVGAATGDLRLKTANGEISVDRAGGAVEAKTANGDVRIGEITRGTAVLETAAGGIAIGIRPGTAALLDVRTRHGLVRNAMDLVSGPDTTDETATVYARTAAGDIVIRRSAPATAA